MAERAGVEPSGGSGYGSSGQKGRVNLMGNRQVRIKGDGSAEDRDCVKSGRGRQGAKAPRGRRAQPSASLDSTDAPSSDGGPEPQPGLEAET